MIRRTRKPHAARKLHGSMFDTTGVIAEVLHCENRNFRPFGFCDVLNLDPMTFIYELDPYSVWRYAACANIIFLCKGFVKLSSDRHTDGTKIYTKPRGQKSVVFFLLMPTLPNNIFALFRKPSMILAHTSVTRWCLKCVEKLTSKPANLSHK